MTPQQIVAVGIRILALWLAAYGLEYVVSVATAMNATNLPDRSNVAYSIGAAFFVLAALLWFFPMVVAHRIVPRTRFENHLKLQALEAARVGCALIGLWLFARVIPSLAWFLLRVAASAGDQSIFRSLEPTDNLQLVFYVVEVAFSFLLILKSATFAELALRNGEPRGGGD